MIKLEKYNPCEEYIDYLIGVVSNEMKSHKKAVIKYDKAKFVTNLTTENINDFSIYNAEVFFNDKGFYVVSPLDVFFIKGIDKCPSFNFVNIDDLQLSGIIKRMYAQIEFGFYCDEQLLQDEISICDNIFKAIYTNSISIKKQQIKQCMEKYDELQKQKYVNKKVIDGIIYAVYDLNNSLYK